MYQLYTLESMEHTYEQEHFMSIADVSALQLAPLY